MKYKSRIGGQQVADIVAVTLESLAKKNNGELTPSLVLEEAKSPEHPLHDFFDWNNTQAAERWRLHQARMLIASVEITIKVNGEEKDIRRYINVTHEDNGQERKYIIIEKAMSNKELKTQILAKALNEFEYWKNKYETYKEFNPIFQDFEIVKAKIIPKLKKKKIYS